MKTQKIPKQLNISAILTRASSLLGTAKLEMNEHLEEVLPMFR